MTRNPLKARLLAGEATRGLWLALTSPAAAEIAGQAGFDWCMIDGEHAPNTLESLAAQLRALEPTPAQACARVPIGEDWVIKQVLDLGVMNILIPMIHDGDAAAGAVAACRYPPEGVRGVGAALARATGFGGDRAYLDEANDAICVMVQAESRAAVENIDAIAGTDGVDVVFIGPADLAADMGHRGNMTHPEVMEAIELLIARIHAAGKVAGTVVFDPDVAQWMAGKGVTFLGIGGDATTLRAGLEALAQG
ncbi:MAG: 2-keto-3-deoxy-L-rhamnonate aldolase [Rhodobacterales bacterium]|nr:MAG: 2-keto-3-deoxy-L-rhamnonate aldolase [Rhodobacterales bacterium]